MIPEGALTPVQGGFRLYLQNNFTHQVTKRRFRFTLAHELAHTFFYEVDGGVPKPIKRSPKGEKLEHLCHYGASQILVPDTVLKQQLKTEGAVASASAILDLAKLFDVSVEVIMRRLQELRLVADEKFAAILVDIVDGTKNRIQAACYGSVLLCNAPRPSRGMDFDSWVRPLLSPSGSARDLHWTCTTQTATITAEKVFRSNRSFILDLKFDPAPIKRAG